MNIKPGTKCIVVPGLTCAKFPPLWGKVVTVVSGPHHDMLQGINGVYGPLDNLYDIECPLENSGSHPCAHLRAGEQLRRSSKRGLAR